MGISWEQVLPAGTFVTRHHEDGVFCHARDQALGSARTTALNPA